MRVASYQQHSIPQKEEPIQRNGAELSNNSHFPAAFLFALWRRFVLTSHHLPLPYADTASLDQNGEATYSIWYRSKRILQPGSYYAQCRSVEDDTTDQITVVQILQEREFHLLSNKLNSVTEVTHCRSGFPA